MVRGNVLVDVHVQPLVGDVPQNWIGIAPLKIIHNRTWAKVLILIVF
jgi:hypothetical protein